MDVAHSYGRDDSRWYAVHCQPHREFLAEAQLGNQGYETFAPRRRKTVSHARKLTTVLAPFFPRYIFVRLDLARSMWRSVNGTRGVTSLVMSDGRPIPVADGVVDALSVLSDAQGILRFDAILNPGDQIRLSSGPFADFVGELCSLDDQGRVQVLLSVMGRSVRVRARSDQLVPV